MFGFEKRGVKLKTRIMFNRQVRFRNEEYFYTLFRRGEVHFIELFEYRDGVCIYRDRLPVLQTDPLEVKAFLKECAKSLTAPSMVEELMEDFWESVSCEAKRNVL